MVHLSYEDFKKVCKLKPMAVSDAVAIRNDSVLLVKRNYPPFRGRWTLPGGFMENDETIEQTCLRELREETGASGKIVCLVGVYSGKGRDPRCNTIDAAFLVQIIKIAKKRDSESSEVKFFPFGKLPKLGFDHSLIVKDALRCYKKMKS